MYNIIYRLGKNKIASLFRLNDRLSRTESVKTSQPVLFFFTRHRHYIMFNTHSHTCHVAHSPLSCNKLCTFSFFFFFVFDISLYWQYIYDYVLYSWSTVVMVCRVTHVPRSLWSSSENSLSFFVFILVCMDVDFVVENRFLRGDDDGNNNSGYRKLKTCQSFSNLLLCRRVDRENRWEGG